VRIFSTMLKAAFGRAGCGRLAALAVLAGQPHDSQRHELVEASVDRRSVYG
jgi:hypothetical protein